MSYQHPATILTESGTESDDDASEFEAHENLGTAVKDTYCCPVICTMACFCHGCYIIQFLLYLVVFPLWCKWLITAPMPYSYWGEAWDDFPRITPIDQTDVALEPPLDQIQIYMSEIPTSQSACNYSCSANLHGYRTNEMNFQVDLRLNEDLAAVNAHTLYPVLMASEDMKHWILVGDRRDAKPDPFFRRSSTNSREYIQQTDACMRNDKNGSFVQQATYVMACVTWNPGNLTVLESEDGTAFASGEAGVLSSAEIETYCDVVGGVCGYPDSGRGAENLEHCTADGILNTTEAFPGMRSTESVFIQGCINPQGDCSTSIEPFYDWPCHTCLQKAAAGADDYMRRRLQDLPELPEVPPLPSTPALPAAPATPGLPTVPGADMPDMPAFSPPGSMLPGIPDPSDLEDGDNTAGGGGSAVRYRSLPRFQVKYDNVKVPDGINILSTPHAFVFASNSPSGPWTKLYKQYGPGSTQLPPMPVASEEEAATIIKQDAAGTGDPYVPQAVDSSHTMELLEANKLTLTSDSCFGKRGPMYLVACAVNQSTYDSLDQWQHSEEARFTPGQKVAPPPFNDRCLAVTGRCGRACMQSDRPMEYCLENGYINQSALVSEIEVQYNRKPTVYMFIYVLLCGFAVKTLMLCPGIFSPYRRCRFYNPEMTEQLRYIVVVGVTGGGDEGKGTMIRNLVGMVSCIPPNCQCLFHVTLNEEGHRSEMLTCWKRFTDVLGVCPMTAGPGSDVYTYEENVRQLMQVWVEETKSLSLGKVGAKVRQLAPDVLNRLSGRSALKKLRKDANWDAFDKVSMDRLEAAIEALAKDLDTNYNKFTPMVHCQDVTADWLPPDPRATPLRLHFTSRAKPQEDPRNIMVQHVAVGTWYYKVPPQATIQDWLELRKNCREMVYSYVDYDDTGFSVPLRSSHGKAGGLNFVDNYMRLLAEKPENLYGTDQDTAPSLYAIADARHQYQPDFMLSCIPCFFDEDYVLNEKVGFTQAPQHYPEYADKNDYLDNNNAQFFRLNAMIRNCCGGVTSCGTNGMWQIPHRDTTVWQPRRKRVRDLDRRKRYTLIEWEQFHTSCKIEDTASSLDRVLVGQHSHFVNRKLSFGMSKSPEGFLGAQQRWVEGAVTLSLQWFTFNADAHGAAARNAWMLWVTMFGFIGYLFALFRLVAKKDANSIFIDMGILPEDALDWFMSPLKEMVKSYAEWLHAVTHDQDTPDYEVYATMITQFLLWIATATFLFFCLYMLTLSCKCFRRFWYFPDEMKWWGRLLINMDNLTYFIWCWTSFFWIGFNYYTALFKITFHFNNLGMMAFMLAVNVLNWGLIISNSLRYSVMESMDANEIAHLSMDNIWRANQLFFMTGPIQLFSVFTGISNFLRYRLYGQDIGGWSGGDLTQVSINIAKYWTTFLIFGCIFCWTMFIIKTHENQNALSACIVVTLIALDVMHPCVFLWAGNNKLTEEEAKKMTCLQALISPTYWKRILQILILNETTTNIMKFLGPAWFLMLPIMTLTSSYFGTSGAFMLVAMGPSH